MVVVFKGVIVVLLLFILFNLGRAMTVMIRGDQEQKMTPYLGKRVALSALVLLLLITAMVLGWLPANPRPY